MYGRIVQRKTFLGFYGNEFLGMCQNNFFHRAFLSLSLFLSRSVCRSFSLPFFFFSCFFLLSLSLSLSLSHSLFSLSLCLSRSPSLLYLSIFLSLSLSFSLSLSPSPLSLSLPHLSLSLSLSLFSPFFLSVSLPAKDHHQTKDQGSREGLLTCHGDPCPGARKVPSILCIFPSPW